MSELSGAKKIGRLQKSFVGRQNQTKARNIGIFVFSGIEIKRNKTKMRTCNEAEAGKAPHFGDSAQLCCCENSASLIKRVSKVEFLRTQVDISKEIYCSKRKKFCSSFFSKPIEQ